MKFRVVVKVRLNKPFAFWKARFDSHRAARKAGGIEDVFASPVLGEQAAVYVVETTTPRAVHDMVYDDRVRPEIEASGFIIGSESITVCEVVD